MTKIKISLLSRCVKIPRNAQTIEPIQTTHSRLNTSIIFFVSHRKTKKKVFLAVNNDIKNNKAMH